MRSGMDSPNSRGAASHQGHKNYGTHKPVDSDHLESHLDSHSLRLSKSRQLSSSRDCLLGDSRPPKDKYGLVCLCFTILGVTTLLPWNFFITATDYWMYKFRDVNNSYETNKLHTTERTPLQTFFESYLEIAANLPMLLSMILNSLFGQRFSQKRRLYVSLSVMLVVFATTTTLVNVNTDQWQSVFFAITMVMVVTISFFSAIFQAAIFGVVASFPQSFMHTMVNGQAMAGLLAVLVQMLSMFGNAGPTLSGFWYFLVSTLFLAFAILCYWGMDNDYTRYYLVKLPNELEMSTPISVNLLKSRVELLETLQDCWPMALTVVFSFWVSLSVFPGVCVLVVPQHPNTSFFTGRFYPILTTFLLFNCGDLAGRFCSTFLQFPTRNRVCLLALAVARTIFPLMIMFCNVHPRRNTPVLFTSDLWFPFLVTATGLTGGYVFSSAMVIASITARKDRLELMGFIMASALGLGLTLGSISSNIILRIL